jgi:adenylate cyclase
MNKTPEKRRGLPFLAGPAEPLRVPLLLMVNPLAVLEQVMRSFVPQVTETADPLAWELPDRKVVARKSRTYTQREAARRAGIAPADMARLWRALGFAEVSGDLYEFTDADVEAFREIAQLLTDQLIDLDLAVTMARPMGHLLSRLGAAQVSALVGLSDRPGGGNGPPAPDAGVAVDRLIQMLERVAVYALRRHLAMAASAELPVGGAGEARPQAVGFVDITSYTALSERLGVSDLTQLLEGFEACVFDQVAAGGRVVKTLGDEVLFVAEGPTAAAEIALSVVEASEADPDLPRVHAGLAYGPLLERAGDVFGPTVNVASRATSRARAGSVIVDQAFRDALGDDHRFRFRRQAGRPVRGYPALVTYRLLRPAADVGGRGGQR